MGFNLLVLTITSKFSQARVRKESNMSLHKDIIMAKHMGMIIDYTYCYLLSFPEHKLFSQEWNKKMYWQGDVLIQKRKKLQAFFHPSWLQFQQRISILFGQTVCMSFPVTENGEINSSIDNVVLAAFVRSILDILRKWVRSVGCKNRLWWS